MGVRLCTSKGAQLAMEGKPTKQQVRKAFYKADKDGNGKLSIDEFKVAILDIIDDPEEKKEAKNMIEMILSSIDSDGDSMVSLEELFMMLDCDKEGNEKQMMMNMIRSADKNKDGFIDAKEMVAVSRKMGGGIFEKEKDFQMLLMMADVDGDGYISKKEIVKFFKIMDLVSDDDEDDPMLKMMVNMMMAEADKDKDGKLNFEEFCAVMDKN